MGIPKFKDRVEVETFLSYQDGGDAWYRPMVEEYVEMCGSDTKEVDITELNAWLKQELTSLENGYDEFLDN